MKLLSLILVIALSVSCTAAQKTEGKTAVTNTVLCTAEDNAEIRAILDDAKLTATQKIVKLAIDVGPELVSCVLAANKIANSVGSGSSK